MIRQQTNAPDKHVVAVHSVQHETTPTDQRRQIAVVVEVRPSRLSARTQRRERHADQTDDRLG